MRQAAILVAAAAASWHVAPLAHSCGYSALVVTNTACPAPASRPQVIDAGQFDMQTNNDERRKNLEALLADEERTKLAMNQVGAELALHALPSVHQGCFSLLPTAFDCFSLPFQTNTHNHPADPHPPPAGALVERAQPHAGPQP